MRSAGLTHVRACTCTSRTCTCMQVDDIVVFTTPARLTRNDFAPTKPPTKVVLLISLPCTPALLVLPLNLLDLFSLLHALFTLLPVTCPTTAHLCIFLVAPERPNIPSIAFSGGGKSPHPRPHHLQARSSDPVPTLHSGPRHSSRILHSCT